MKSKKAFVLSGAALILFLIFGFIIIMVGIYIFVKALPFLIILAVIAMIIGLIYYLITSKPKPKEETISVPKSEYCKTNPTDARCQK